MKKSRIMIAAVIMLVMVLITGFVCWHNVQYSDPLVGTWMLYEGGSVAPEVLTFRADGSGMAYALSDAYQDNRMTDVQIPQSCLEQAESFQWRVENGC